MHSHLPTERMVHSLGRGVLAGGLEVLWVSMCGGSSSSGHFFWLQREQQVPERGASPFIVCRCWWGHICGREWNWARLGSPANLSKPWRDRKRRGGGKDKKGGVLQLIFIFFYFLYAKLHWVSAFDGIRLLVGQADLLWCNALRIPLSISCTLSWIKSQSHLFQC